MNDTFTAGHVFQAIVGASVHPERRTPLLEKVATGLRGDRSLPPAHLREGVLKALEVGAISQAEAAQYFGLVTIDAP
ncbi:MAG: hypothetical protein HQL64_10540 [Magnetococcales bacterium]|nr:hypothetical protein [Magnetococcales bacterium]